MIYFTMIKIIYLYSYTVRFTENRLSYILLIRSYHVDWDHHGAVGQCLIEHAITAGSIPIGM